VPQADMEKIWQKINVLKNDKKWMADNMAANSD
jgi:hypothetical protein